MNHAMNHPKVSVIIPVYNTEKYVKESVESIMQQTLQDIEIIIINDGSTDNSLSVINLLAQQDRRIIVYSQSNQGLSIARNTGLERVKGEFIYFMDSDDLLTNDALKTCYQECIAEQLDFVFLMLKVSMMTIDFQEHITINGIWILKTRFGMALNC